MGTVQFAHINNLRIRARGGGIDPLSARARMESLLSNVTLHPPGLSSSAIVCIRRLCDPKPGALCLWRTDMRPLRDWEKAVAESIEMLTQRAARPALSLVPADAEAVLFLDRSELLACLARDWSEGMTTQWWWKSLFRNTVTAGMLMHQWLETPEYNPGALRILAEQGKVAPFASKLSGNEVVALVRGMTQKFGLAHLQAALDGQFINKETNRAESIKDKEKEVRKTSSWTEGTIDQVEEGGIRDLYVPNLARRSANSGPIPPPWRRFVPESTAPSLGPEQQALIGIGLMLTRAPAEIRKSSFAEAIDRWKTALTGPGSLDPKQEQARTRETNSRSEPSASRHSGLDPESGNVTEKPLDSRFSGNDERTSSPVEKHQYRESRREGQFDIEDASSIVDTGLGGRDNPSMMQSRAMEAAQSGLLNETVIETDLGGLFYLVNLGLYLGLYGDFTTPLQPGIDLSIWDFITLAGRRLVGETASDDPVWSLLAALAGRNDGATPGAGFEPPDEWRLPISWLESFSLETAWRWSSDDDRLRLLHGEGFVVLDVARTSEEPLVQLSHEIKTYGQAVPERIEPLDLACQDPTHTPLEQWLDRLLPYIQARLRRAFGTTDDEEVHRLLIRSRARIRATETNLDVHFSLDDLPVEIRVAGLDRDPGWVPAAGRYVAFHYE
jgi:hypothetical protein